MGLLDFLFDDRSAEERQVSSLEDTLTNMYVQPGEREHAIARLAELGTQPAIRALLSRFEEQAPNTTVDIDEKEQVYETLASIGREEQDEVVEAISEYLESTDEKVNWPLKVLDDLLSDEAMCEKVRELLSGCDTEYKKTPEKKQELMLRAADYHDEDLTEEVMRFLQDDNETIRFLATEAVLEHGFEDMMETPLLEQLIEENSLRIIKKLAAAFKERKHWKIPEDKQEQVEAALPDEYSVHKHGHIYKERD